MRDPIRPETSIQGRQFPRDGTTDAGTDEQVDLGDLCLSVGNLSDALAYYRDALGKVREDNPGAKRDIILKVVDCLRRQSKHEDALCFLTDVMTGFAGTERRDLLAEKATLLCLLGRYGEAAEVCTSARAEEPTGARKGDARIYLVLGHVLLRVCKWKEAVRCFEQAATFARMCDDLTCLGNSLNNLGIAYKNLCRFDVSSRYLAKAVAVARREKNDASLAVRLLNLANTAYKTGSAREAGRAIAEAISIAESLNLSRLRVLGLITRARIEMLDGGFGRARDLLDEAIEKTGTLEDPRASAVAHETLGELLTLTGDLAGAKAVLEKCVEEAPSQCRDVEAEVNSRMADLRLAGGDVTGARRYAEAGVTIAREIGDKFEMARCQRTLGLVQTGKSGRVAGLKKAERLFRRIGAVAEAAITAHHIARCLREAGRRGSREVTGHLGRALAGFEACGLSSRMTGALCDLAQVCLDEGRHERALRYIERAEDLAGSSPLRETAREVRSRIDAGLSNALMETSDNLPASPHEAFDHLAGCAGISGLVLAEAKDGAAGAIIETFGLAADRARGILERVEKGLPSTRFLSNVKATWGDLGTPDVRALLAVPFERQGTRGLVLLTWARPLGGDSGSAARIMRADYECRRVLPVLCAALGRTQETAVPVCICGIVSADPKMKQMLFSLSGIAAGSANVFITGETGTGKELVARAIHMLSARADRPFVAQNCAALPEHLLESELFGYRSGAFTGARGEKRGLLETAHGGIFFLDEVGDVSPAIQAKMLRAIEAGEIRRLGDTVSRNIDVRYLSATNRRLDEEVAEGGMRQDLYYRLNVVSVTLPPLRDREADVPLLAGLFLRRFSARMSKKIKRIEEGAMSALAGYDWPGNVRQLENEMERAVTLTAVGGAVTRQVLSAPVGGLAEGGGRSTLKSEVRMVERRRIMAALRQHGWNKTHAARALGDISRPALIAKMKKLGIPLKRAETHA